MCIRVDDDRLLQAKNEARIDRPEAGTAMAWRTLRQRARDALLMSERLEDVARASGDWLWETDEHHRYSWVHDSCAMRHAHGLRPPRVGELIPAGVVVDWLGAPEVPLRNLHAVLERGEPIVRLITKERERGRVHYVSRSAVPMLRADGSLRGYRGSARDVTQSLGAKLQLWRRDEGLRHAKEQAEASSAAKSALVSKVGHELRTPLNAIVGLAQLIQERQAGGGDPAVVDEWIAQIARTGWHMVDVLDLLMELGRAGAAGATLACEPVDAAAVAREALRYIERDAQARGIGIVVDGPAAVWAAADRRAVGQVVINLLSNAVKYNRPGGSVWLRVKGGDHVSIEVQDTGPGLTEAQVCRLFRPFERLGVRDSEVKGHGLGLAICKELVGAMGGTLRAQGVAGQGTTFSVRLPLACASQGARPGLARPFSPALAASPPAG